MFDNNIAARDILHHLERNVTPKVKANRTLVDEFIEKFRATLVRKSKDKDSFTIHPIHGGSAYENLSVSNKTDFDVTISLGGEFVSENFDVERDPSGYFTLEGKRDMRYLDCNRYLDASKLRSGLFSALGHHAELVQMPNVTIKCSEGLSALCVELEEKTNPWRKVSIDLVPQIPFHTWGQCPDLLPLEDMPKCLRQYIDTINKNKSPVMFFSMGVPRANDYSNSDQLFNISFSLLEKRFVNSMPELRNMIRLVKYIAHCRDWKSKHHFKSFYAKRVAVKYYNELEGKDVWDGCQVILSKLIQEVRNLVIDGHFVGNQPLREWTKDEAGEFIREITTVLNMNVRDIQKE